MPETRKQKVAVWVAGGVGLVVLAVVLALVLTPGNRPGADGPAVSPGPPSGSVGSGSVGSGSVGTGSGPDQTPVPSPYLPSSTVTGPPTVVPTVKAKRTQVPLKSPAAAGDEVTVRVTKTERVKGVARGPGEIAGPAVRVTIKVSNQSSGAIPMDLALVNLYYGKHRNPATVLSGPKAKPLAGPIGPGQSASGRYVFGVPKSGANPIAVEFSYTTDAPTVIFRGNR